MKTTQMLGGCIADMLFYTTQLKMTHFLALKNHNHTEIDEGRIEIIDELDELVEGLLGTYVGKLKPEDILPTGKSNTYHFALIKTPEQILSYLDMMQKRANKGLSLVENDPELKFLSDPIMDIIQIIAGMKYVINQE